MEEKQFSPKADGLPGSVQERFVRCGSARCACMAGGVMHGPYYRRVWREGGRTRSAYVRLADSEATMAACDHYKFVHMSRRGFWRMLREFERVSDLAFDGLVELGVLVEG